MIRTHKIRLHPTEEQKNYFARAAGTSRFVWNWALAEWNRQYEAGEKPTALKLKKQFNEIRREQFPWMWQVTKNASDQPFLDLGKAWTAFFEGRKNGTKAGRPKFKSKKKSKASFYLANDQLELGDHRVWIPKLGWVNMAENLRFKGKITGARLTKTADWWFISVSVELPDEHPDPRTPAVGIDVGLNRLATLSTGEGYENQAFLKTALKKLRQANKRLHRRVKGSKNREKARREVARLHYQITCMREDVLHKLTVRLDLHPFLWRPQRGDLAHQLFVHEGTHVLQGGVSPAPIIETLDVFKGGASGLRSCLKGLTINAFAFETMEEAFHRRIIIAVGSAAHTDYHAFLL